MQENRLSMIDIGVHSQFKIVCQISHDSELEYYYFIYYLFFFIITLDIYIINLGD